MTPWKPFPTISKSSTTSSFSYFPEIVILLPKKNIPPCGLMHKPLLWLTQKLSRGFFVVVRVCAKGIYHFYLSPRINNCSDGKTLFSRAHLPYFSLQNHHCFYRNIMYARVRNRSRSSVGNAYGDNMQSKKLFEKKSHIMIATACFLTTTNTTAHSSWGEGGGGKELLPHWKTTAAGNISAK